MQFVLYQSCSCPYKIITDSIFPILIIKHIYNNNVSKSQAFELLNVFKVYIFWLQEEHNLAVHPDLNKPDSMTFITSQKFKDN